MRTSSPLPLHTGWLLAGLVVVLAGCPNNPTDDTSADFGCITVDGQGGYRYLADALEHAGPGSSIELCSADIEESVVVAQDITIVGTGSATTHWFPPTNEPALVISSGANVAVRDLQIISTRNAITVEEGASLDISDVQILGAGSYGIEATAATVTADNLVIEDTIWGAIRINGGALTLDASRLDGNTGWGVLLEDGAEGAITETIIRNTVLSDEEATEWDGWAVGLKGSSSVTVFGGSLSDNVLGAVYAEGLSSAEVDGVEANGNYFGFWFENSDLDLSNATVDEPDLYAILAQAGSNITLTNVDLTNDPLTSRWEDDTNFLRGSYGILMQSAGSLTVTDSVISGHNGGGFYVVGTLAANMPATLTNTVVDDNGAQGGIFQWVDLTLDEVTLSGTRNDDDLCVDGSTYSCNWGFAAFQSDVVWTGGAIADNETMGLVANQGSVELVDVDVSGNEMYGLWMLSSALDLSDSAVSGWGETAIQLQSSVGLLRNVTFSDRDYVWSYQSDNIEYRYFDQATDVFATDSTLFIEDSAFTDGNEAVDVSTSDVTVSNTSFSGYDGYGIDVYAGTLDVTDSTFVGMGPRTLYCFGQGSLGFEDVTFTGTINTMEHQEVWTDGVLTSSYDYTTSGPALYASGCGIDLEGVTFDGSQDQAMEFLNSDVELDEVVVRDVNTANAIDEAAVELRWSSESANAWMYDVEITGVANGAALQIIGWALDPAPSVTLGALRIGHDDGALSGVVGEGIHLQDIAGLTLDAFDVSSTAAALLAERSTGAVTGTGLDPSYFGTLTSGAAEGLMAVDSQLTINDVTVTSAATAGFLFHGGTHAIQDIAVDAAGTWGLECPTDPPSPPEDVPAFSTCTYLSVTGTSGDVSGCACTQQ